MNSRIVRYVLSGLLSFTVENSTFFAFFYGLHIHVAVANILSIACAMIVNFFVSKYFVFRDGDSTAKTHRQFVSYAVLVGCNLLISTLVVSTLVGWNVPGYIAKPIMTLCVAAWTYLIYVKVIFKNNPTTVHLSDE